MRGAFLAQQERLGDVGEYAVQRMAPTGVACRLATLEDPLFGPVLSFGLGGVATDLLGDRSYGVPPLTDADLSAMVRSVRAAPLLLGHAGSAPADLAAVEDLLARLARLADDLPEVAAPGAQPGGRLADRRRRCWPRPADWLIRPPGPSAVHGRCPAEPASARMTA